MIALRSHPSTDLLSEVDVMSAVSGGALPATYYAATRDVALGLPPQAARRLGTALTDADAPRQLKVGPDGMLTCSADLDDDARAWLSTSRSEGSHLVDQPTLDRIQALCRQSGLTGLRAWSDDDARERMSRNYLARMVGNMLWPTTFMRYWFTSYDRSDIMAQTLSDSLFDSPVVGRDHRFGDLNPTRPFLVVHATNATDFPDGGEHEKDADEDPGHRLRADVLRPPFGSSFTFTREDFQERLHSDIDSYPLGNAVMASSAFPLAFPHVTLENFHSLRRERRCATGEDALATCSDRRYVHLIDGGNNDNLGLRSIKRILLDMAWSGRLIEDHDAIVVLLVDAFANPTGSTNQEADPRGTVGRIVDVSTLSQAVDVLLQRNRQQTLAEFVDPKELIDIRRDCDHDQVQLPRALCSELERLKGEGGLTQVQDFLDQRLVFHRIGLDTIAGGDRKTKRELDRIPTSFMIDDKHVDLIRNGVEKTLRKSDHACFDAIASIVAKSTPSIDDTRAAQASCASQSPPTLPATPLREAQVVPPSPAVPEATTPDRSGPRGTLATPMPSAVGRPRALGPTSGSP